MDKIQIMLEEGQNEKLSYAARRMRKSKSCILREALEAYLRQNIPETEDPLLQLIGQAGSSKETDISENHDEYLAKTEKERWS